MPYEIQCIAIKLINDYNMNNDIEENIKEHIKENNFPLKNIEEKKWKIL